MRSTSKYNTMLNSIRDDQLKVILEKITKKIKKNIPRGRRTC